MALQLELDFTGATPVMPATRRSRGAVGYHAGLSAEQAVARNYDMRGYPILAQRWRGKGGEIDLIAQDGDGLVFIEVKKSRTFGRACERLSARQVHRLCCAAEEFVDTQPHGALTAMRFDLAMVDSIGAIRVMENIVGP